jgi:hypothetical protein
MRQDEKRTHMEEAQRKIPDYYKNGKNLLQETTTRQDTQQDKELMKDTRTRHKTRNTRQSATRVHRRTTPSHRKAEPKAKNEARARRPQQKARP